MVRLPSAYPEGLEKTPPKFAIEARNKWMLRKADYCLCYIQHPWGGAYKFARTAKYGNLEVENLGIFKIYQNMQISRKYRSTGYCKIC